MAPTLSQANSRKWWIAVTSVLENLMFAAVLLGWSSLLLMLKNEGFYSNVCKVGVLTEENGTSSIENDSSTMSTTIENDTDSEIKYTPAGFPTCPDQNEILNRYFSIGSSLLSGVTVILGVIMDKYGSRMIRLCGTLTFMASCVLFAIGSLDTENLSILMAPAVCLNGMGGVVYIFTSFPIPNLFENLRSTMISLMIGSYSASAIMYMLFKAAYDAGVPFQAIMIFHASIAFLTFLNCYFNTPGEPIPGPDDISYAIKLRFGAMNFDHKVTGKKFLTHTSSVGRRMSSIDIAPSEKHDYLESVIDISGNKSGPDTSFLQVLRSPCLLWSFVTMCLTQLRLIAYMGWLELYLRSSAEQQELNDEEASETVEFYTFLFGLFQINCFFMAPIIGTIMDWNLKEKKKKKSKEILDSSDSSPALSNGAASDRKQSVSNGHAPNGRVAMEEPAALTEGEKQFKRKKQQIFNLARAFMITNLLLTLFGVIILFEKILPLQIVAFIAHTAIRTFLHSSVGGLYACMYHFSYFGKLTGLVSFLSAMAILIQDPLFVCINTSLGGDPFWVNFALLVITIFGFGLPIYLWRYGRNMKPPTRDSPQEREMFTIDEGDAEQEDGFAVDISQRLRVEEPAVHVSSMAIAL